MATHVQEELDTSKKPFIKCHIAKQGLAAQIFALHKEHYAKRCHRIVRRHLSIICGQWLQKTFCERASYHWLRQRSGLGDLIDYDFEGMGLDRLYQVSDLFWKHRESLESHLHQEEATLFSFDETITGSGIGV